MSVQYNSSGGNVSEIKDKRKYTDHVHLSLIMCIDMVCIIMLKVYMLSAVMLSIIMLCVVLLSVMLSVILLCLAVLRFSMPSVNRPTAIMLGFIRQNICLDGCHYAE